MAKKEALPQAEGHNLSKLITFMAKVVPEGEGITFYDDGSHQIVQMAASVSVSVTAVLPSGGKTIAPVTMRRQDFLKGYRPNAKLSGSDGKLNMSLVNWRMALLGSVEAVVPKPTIIEGDKMTADVAALKSVPSEDSYGGSTWAVFLPSGMAIVCSTYSMVGVTMADNAKPKKPIVMQANAIYPMLNMVEPKLTVNENAVGIRGKFPMGKFDADVYVALSKPSNDPPPLDEIEGMLPTPAHRLSVSAMDLRVCIEGAKKTFDDEATNLSFMLSEKGLSISLQSQTAALTETLPYVKRPKRPEGKLLINTDVIVNAFKGMRELTTAKATANIRWDENAVYMRIMENDVVLGVLVIATAGDE